MNAQRAQEIVSSTEMIDVMYNGDKVYIEHVDQGAGKATVHPLHDEEVKQSVAVSELMEE
ncbi:H-type small acid-soluble spore protein [Salibacterium salarium]|uniref:Small, acid-soluble spore protein H n=1 Tax=Salibacterium salarium TaxID=284579 RepID=A0A428MX06_9BACI|nr:H-type small acid-soluble spore protein [Salibacterium salarium]RSL30703.1 H-type small acid-soluble spore protein [Salibacterium salarium]